MTMAATWKRVATTLLLGQLLSLLITGTGVTSTLLAEQAGVSLPGTQSLLAYTLLALVYPAALGIRRRWGLPAATAPAAAPLRRVWWQYAVVALLDVEANYIVVLAYQYTSITSVMLLDCFAIPVVMLLSRWRFGQRYSRIQLGGVAVSLCGVGLLVTSDVLNGRNDPNAPNPALGDALCLLGATLYAVCNVWQEELVKSHGRLEFVALLSLFAVPISLVQTGALEGALWPTVHWSGQVVGLFIGFAVCLFCVYSLFPVFLAAAGATPLNLSLLSSDFYALLFGIVLFGFEIDALYVVAFVAVVVGVVLYERFPAPTAANVAGMSTDTRDGSATELDQDLASHGPMVAAASEGSEPLLGGPSSTLEGASAAPADDSSRRLLDPDSEPGEGS